MGSKGSIGDIIAKTPGLGTAQALSALAGSALKQNVKKLLMSDRSGETSADKAERARKNLLKVKKVGKGVGKAAKKELGAKVKKELKKKLGKSAVEKIEIAGKLARDKKTRKFAGGVAKDVLKGTKVVGLDKVLKKGRDILKDPQVSTAARLAATVPTTGFTGIAIRNRKQVAEAARLAASKKGFGGKVSALGKGLLKVAAGQDPKTKRATKKLIGPAAKNAALRIARDIDTFGKAAQGIPGIGEAISAARSAGRTAGKLFKSAVK